MSFNKLFFPLLIMIVMSACGGGGGNSGDGNEDSGDSIDTTAPVITLNGDSSITLFQNDDYIEQGATAVDNIDSSINVIITGEVNTSNVGNYTITYTATDVAGNSSSINRTIDVLLPPDTTPPVITLIGDSSISLIVGTNYIELGATAIDERDGAINVVITGEIDNNTVGSYTITYNATDTTGNNSNMTRIVNVVLPPDTTPPVITLNGQSNMTLIQSETYFEPGATAVDDRDGTVGIIITGIVDTDTVGNYTVTYTATDTANNIATANRNIEVVLPPDTTPPVVTLNGESVISLVLGESYIELGATAIDDRDETVDVIISGTVDTTTVGNYQITYTATDSSNNVAMLTRTIEVVFQSSFITIWKTDNSGFTNDNQIKIGTSGGGYNYQIDWGDGEIDTNVTEDIIHTYATSGTYIVTINGRFPQIFFDNSEYDNNKLLSVEQWGNIEWQSMNQAFYNCNNMIINAEDIPDLSQVTSMRLMFYNADSFNQNINNWDVSSVIDMSGLFLFADIFNQDLSSWDVSSVTDMSGIFRLARNFDQDLSSWDVSSVTNMSEMFQDAESFNQNINSWDVSSVTDMSNMFSSINAFNHPLNMWDVSSVTDMSWMFNSAKSFDQDLSAWDVSSVTNMSRMFAGTFGPSIFNQDISGWDVSAVTDMGYMFYRNREFNQDISNWNVSSVSSMNDMFRDASSFNNPLNSWDVSAVKYMGTMFFGATSFNQNISDWDVSSVTSMSFMFRGASSFNQDLSSWNVSQVTSMRNMFVFANNFNQDLSNWDVSSVADMSSMFSSASNFNQDLSMWNISSVTNMTNMFDNITLSTANYDALLQSWSVQSLQSDVIFSAGNSQYSDSAQSARDVFTNTYNWTITDGGVEVPTISNQ